MNIKVLIPRGGNDDQKYNTLAEPSLKKIKAQGLQIFDKDKNINESIFKKYNAGIKALLENGLLDDDIVIFMHSDTLIIDNIFREKVELIFNEKSDIGLVGVVGSTEITEQGGWWMNNPLIHDKDGNEIGSLVGHLIQGKGQVDYKIGYHLQKGAIGFFDNLAAIDGCLMITNGKIIRDGLIFDEKTYDGNDFYDIDICMKVLEMGYKVAVADILIFHDSPGMGVFTDSWKNSKDKFIKKWTDKGYKLPFTSDQFNKKDSNTEIIEL